MSNTAKVGIFATVALVLLGYFILRIEDLNLLRKGETRIEAAFDSVAGLDDKAAVRVAGVRVGRVDGIRLEADRAYASLLLERPVDLRQGATATIANMGLLGDKYVELDPGPVDAMPLSPPIVLPGSTPVGWDDAMARLNDISLAVGEALEAMDPETTGATVKNLVRSLESTTETIRAMVLANQAQIAGTVANFERFSLALAEELPRISQQTADVLTTIETMLAENRGDARGAMSQLAAASESLRSTLEDFEGVSDKIARGEGTIGKLLNSEEAHQQLVATLDSVESGVSQLSETLDRVNRIGLELDLNAYYLEEPEDSRTEFAIRLDSASTNRFYRLGLVDDPRGDVSTRTEEITVTDAAGMSETTTRKTVTSDDDEVISAQVGFELGKSQFRAGLFESSGGAAFDYKLFDERVLFSVEAFQFSREDDLEPRLRLTTRWNVHPNAYIVGGVDDLLEEDRESVFLGAGLRWNDDDLKFLLGSIRPPG